MYTQPKLVLQALDRRIGKSAFSRDVTLYVVLGHPRSDIGKGTLAAHLLRMLPTSNVIKFDGMLNSNLDHRFTARDHDDFATYTRYNHVTAWQPGNHLLGGELLRDFVVEYGDTDEVLSFRPYLMKYFTARLQENWRCLGSPPNLVIEIGGVPDDFEVDTFALPAISGIKDRLGSRCVIMVLTELAHNNQFVKTKPTRDAVMALRKRGVNPDIILAREPLLVGPVDLSVRLDFERRIREKLLENANETFSRILSVPHYEQADMHQYESYLRKNLLPLVQPNRPYDQLLIGSSNQNKINEWTNELGGLVDIVTPEGLGLDLEVHEGLVSVSENSMGKAKVYCRASGLPTVSDDVGFFIDALHGLPGVAVRRWGGLLPESTTDEEFFAFLTQQMSGVVDTTAYFERCVSVALPNGDDYQVSYQVPGHIDTDLLARGYAPGEFPLGDVFRADGEEATWNQMDDAARVRIRRRLNHRIEAILADYMTLKQTRRGDLRTHEGRGVRASVTDPGFGP